MQQSKELSKSRLYNAYEVPSCTPPPPFTGMSKSQTIL